LESRAKRLDGCSGIGAHHGLRQVTKTIGMETNMDNAISAFPCLSKVYPHSAPNYCNPTVFGHFL
jgi:hypothetical protein